MLPQDPFILLSFVNTQLRDRFDSLEALCEEHQCAPEELRKKLEAAGLHAFITTKFGLGYLIE